MKFRQKIAKEALEARQEMVRNGELLREGEFRNLLRLSESRLRGLVATGSVFTINVNGVEYFPSLLAQSDVDHARLYSVCRILVPAPADCRLLYLSSRQGNLGGISPLVALRDEQSYRLLRCMARAYAIGWWRTSVAIYAGLHLGESPHSAPIVTTVAETDPRVSVWERAVTAIRSGGYIHPPGPYANANVATVFVALHPSGHALATTEVSIEVKADDGMARAFVVCRDAPGYELNPIAVSDLDSILEVVLRIVTAARACQLGFRKSQRADGISGGHHDNAE